MARWTRETARDYLASNPNFIPVKPLNDYSTDYLKRTASAFQAAEQAGREAPSTAKRRGHELFNHLSAKGNRLNQWVTEKPKRREISQADLLDMYKAARKGASKTNRDEVLILITGVVQYIPIKGSIPDNGIQTLSFWSDMGSLKESIDVMADIFDFATDLSQLEWETVEAVSFAFPNE